jgi:hypothetical protein
MIAPLGTNRRPPGRRGEAAKGAQNMPLALQALRQLQQNLMMAAR